MHQASSGRNAQANERHSTTAFAQRGSAARAGLADQIRVALPRNPSPNPGIYSQAVAHDSRQLAARIMNAAIFASAFHPSLGGVEELVRQLAHEVQTAGHWGGGNRQPLAAVAPAP